MEGRTIGAKYELEREFAKGGMGSLWVAFDQKLRRRVAIKLMKPDQLTVADARRRFEHEAMAIAQLQNPHVVQVYDYGIDEGTPYIVMELLAGEDLQTRLTRHRRLPLASVITLLTQAAKGLSAAHAAGIVHCDLKPANIFLARIGAEETVKVLDFGVAALATPPPAIDLHSSGQGRIIGTPHYMSPEQLRDMERYDHRNDLWALAVVAYRALTGSLPFTAEGLGSLVIQICDSPIPPPSSFAPDIDREVDAFFARALAREPSLRFQSARELAAALAAIGAVPERERPTKLLVVDDEPDMASLITQIFQAQLRSFTYEILFASDGEEALEKLRVHPDVDVILTDINMPRLNGLAMLERVAEISPTSRVIIVSAYGDMSNIRRAMNLGAFDFLVKPIDVTDLRLTIDKTRRHVQEVKKTLRSMEENSVLRSFIHGGLIERLLPMVRAEGTPLTETFEATVAVIGVCPGDGEAAETPEGRIDHLNEALEVIIPEVTSRKGLIDKLFGDAVVTIFRDASQVERAVDACLIARDKLRGLSAGEELRGSLVAGIDRGVVIAGGVGQKTLSRLTYTVLGDAVETAAHLRSLAARDQILVSEPVHTSMGDACECAFIGSMKARDTREPVRVYDVMRRISELSTDAAMTTILKERGRGAARETGTGDPTRSGDATE